MEYLQLGQYALASLDLKKPDGTLVRVYGEPAWSSSDPAVLSCEPSVGNPGYAQIRGLRVGQVQLFVDGSYDTGKGIKQWGTVTLDIEIINQEVATGEIKLNYGEVVPIEPPGRSPGRPGRP